jgi:hypothetical protein
MSYECPSARIFNRGLRRFWELFADGLRFVTMVEFRLDPGCFICFWQYWNSFPSAMVVEGRFCRMCCGWNSFFPFNQLRDDSVGCVAGETPFSLLIRIYSLLWAQTVL